MKEKQWGQSIFLFSGKTRVPPPMVRAFLHTALSAAEALELPLSSLGTKHRKSALCLWPVLLAPQHLNTASTVCLSLVRGLCSPLSTASTASAVSACLSMQSCLGMGWLFTVSCSFVILLQELPGWSWKKVLFKRKPYNAFKLRTQSFSCIYHNDINDHCYLYLLRAQ